MCLKYVISVKEFVFQCVIGIGVHGYMEKLVSFSFPVHHLVLNSLMKTYICFPLLNLLTGCKL